MEGRVVILSDLHLGRPHGAAISVDALRPLWADATHVVINGDLAEVHHPHHRGEAARATLKLFDACERDGVELTILSGNHDPYLSDLRHLVMAHGAVFVTHGDVLHPAVAPWSPAAGRIRRAHEAALNTVEGHLRSDLATRLAAAQHASYTEWKNIDELEKEACQSTFLGMFMRPWAMMRVLHYWRIVPRLAADFVAEHAPDARFVVIGHTHHAGVWRHGPRTVINTGSFGFPGRPHAVVVERGTLAFQRIITGAGVYALHDTPRAVFDLETDHSRRATIGITTAVPAE